MLWAALGIVRPPVPDALVFGSHGADSTVRIWRFVQDGDTLDYRETRGGAQVLEAEWRREGKGLARSRTPIDAQRTSARARMEFPGGRARFEITLGSVATAAGSCTPVWRGA